MYKYEIYFQSEGHGAKDAFIYIYIENIFKNSVNYYKLYDQ